MYDFFLIRSKTDYIEYKFRTMRSVSNIKVKVEDHIIPWIAEFKYLEPILQNNGEIKMRCKLLNSSRMVEMEENLKNFIWHDRTAQIEGEILPDN